MTIRLLHISDLHLHGDPQRDQLVAEALASIAERYATHHLVVTGDIVDDGEATQLRSAYQLLSPFAGRLSLCPGNHDVGVLGNFYSADAARRFDRLLARPLGQGPYAGPQSGPSVDVLVDPEQPENRYPFDESRS
jgi:3',5'-cyclic AMP phosphodiesterase CpdA